MLGAVTRALPLRYLTKIPDRSYVVFMTAIPMMTVHYVLAGAYRGKRAKLDALLTHASSDGSSTAVCGKVAEGNLCDEEVAGPPTCKACAKRYA